VQSLLARGAVVRVGSLLYAADAWERLRATSSTLLAAYHQQHPLRAGMPREEWRSRLGLAPREAAEVASAIGAAGELAEAGGGRARGAPAGAARGAFVRLPGHEPRPTPEQERAIAALLARFRAEPFAPPTRPEVEQELGPELAAALVERGTLI